MQDWYTSNTELNDSFHEKAIIQLPANERFELVELIALLSPFPEVSNARLIIVDCCIQSCALSGASFFWLVLYFANLLKTVVRSFLSCTLLPRRLFVKKF